MIIIGCDIHTMAETGFDRENGEGVYWSGVTAPIFTHAYYRPDKPRSTWNYPFSSTPYRGRNYRLFSKLADVRNGGSGVESLFSLLMGGGLANRQMERDAIQPLDQPRGVPEDASDEWKREVEGWGIDMHSHSYFTLEELETAKENGLFEDSITERGWIKLDQYIELRENGTTPTSWSGGVGGGSVKHLDVEEAKVMSIDELKALAESDKAEKDSLIGGIYVNADWPATYGEDTYSEFFRTMEEMRELLVNERIPANRVRLVFGFDN